MPAVAAEAGPARAAPGPARGERERFDALYERTAPRLRSYLRRLTGSPEIADDLLQDAYVRFLGAAPPVMTEEQTMSYLYTIATRLTYDRWRRDRLERSWAESVRTAADEPGDADAGEPLSPDVQAALDVLHPRERALLWLAYVEGRPHREIAPILGVRTPSVKVLLFRARRQLAGLLDARGLAPEVPCAAATAPARPRSSAR